MGSLTAATPLNLGVAVGQVAEPQSAYTQLIKNASYPVGTNGWTASAGAAVAAATQRFSAAYLPGILTSSNGAAGFVQVYTITGATAGQQHTFQFIISADLGFTGLTPASPLARIEINWSGGTARTDYIQIDPRSGITGANENFVSLKVEPFYTRAQDGTDLLVFQVTAVTSAIPAGTTAGAFRVYPRVDQPTGVTGEIAFAAPMLVLGNDVGAFVSGLIASQYPYSSLFGSLPRETIAPRFPKVINNGNYTVVSANEAGTVILMTQAASTLTLDHDTAYLGTDITVINKTGGALTVAAQAGDLFFGPGFSAAGVASFSMPSGASFPNAAVTLTGEESVTGSGIIHWYITWSNVGPFTSGGIPITPIVPVGAAGTIIRSDGTNWVASQDTWPDLVASGNVLFATAANTVGSSTNFNFSGTTLTIGSASVGTIIMGAVGCSFTNNLSNLIRAGNPIEASQSIRFRAADLLAWSNNNGNWTTLDSAILRGGASNSLQYGASGSDATARIQINKSITGIQDATPTATFTITIPNGEHSAILSVTLNGALGAGGAIGADEASATVTYDITITRVAGVNAVAVASVAYGAAAANVAGAATMLIAAAVSAIAGAVGATNTFTVDVTITKVGGASNNHTCLCYGRLSNANASGITIT